WTPGGTPRYQFVQDVFGFGFSSGASASSSASSVTFPATEPGPSMHFVSSRHTNNETLTLRSTLALTGVTLSPNATALATSGGRPLLVVRKYGLGRAVQWLSYDWIAASALGPIGGMDDLVWRGIVWAARKPFVIRGLPSFVTMRIDDVEGPFWWVP